MARTVYDNQRVFTAEVKAGSFDKTLPYAILVYGKHESLNLSTKQTLLTKGSCLIESKYPIYAEPKTLSAGGTSLIINIYADAPLIVSGSVSVKLNSKVTFREYIKLYNGSEGNAFVECTLGTIQETKYRGGDMSGDSDDKYSDNVFNRMEGCVLARFNIGRVFTQNTVYTPYKYDDNGWFGADITDDESLVGFERVDLLSHESKTSRYEQTWEIDYTNVSNPVFSSGQEWYAWCKEHDNG
jgi:hypothetical protein